MVQGSSVVVRIALCCIFQQWKWGNEDVKLIIALASINVVYASLYLYSVCLLGVEFGRETSLFFQSFKIIYLCIYDFNSSIIV